jgi:hypothetical protein
MASCYSLECVELDFSHLAAQRTASANGSINARETFFGSVCAGDTQKVSDLHRLFPYAHEEALLQWTHCRKDIPKEHMGLEKPQRE